MARIFSGQESNGTVTRILWDIRLPRAIAVLLLGGALSLAGYLLQTFFNNPIAGPFVLGISSGAKMVVALVMVFLMGRGVRVTSATMILAAFIGAMLSMGFVLLMSHRIHNMSMLVVSGVMIGYICSAVTELVVTFANDADIVNLHNWSRGKFFGNDMGKRKSYDRCGCRHVFDSFSDVKATWRLPVGRCLCAECGC